MHKEGGGICGMCGLRQCLWIRVKGWTYLLDDGLIYRFNKFYLSTIMKYNNNNNMTTNLHSKIKISDSPLLQDTLSTNRKNNTANRTQTDLLSQFFNNKIQRSQPNTKNRILNTESAKDYRQTDIIVVQYGDQAQIELRPKGRVFEKGLSKILFLRLVRYLHQLKSTYLSLIEVVRQQEEYFKQQSQRWSVQLLILSQKMQQKERLRQINSHNKLSELQQAVKLRDQLIAELNRMISNIKKEAIKEEGQQTRTVTPCSNCSLLEIKLTSVKEEAVAMAKKQAKLMEEYQNLQQRVFDLEQQVVGIELQVERRLKQALQSIPQLSFYNQTNQQIINSMNRQNQTLRTKCQKLEKHIRDEQILRTKEEQLKAIQKQYQLKNEALLQAIARNENVIQLSYERQHHLLLAQQNLSKKIEELRKKEAELSQWENNLIKDHNIKSNYNAANMQTFGRNRIMEEEDQPSLRSFGFQPHQYEQAQYNFNPSQTINNKVENINEEVYIPMLPLHQRQQYYEQNQINGNYKVHQSKYTLNKQKSKKSLSRNNPKSITESAYAYRSPYLMEKSKHSASNHNLHIKSPAQRQNNIIQTSIQGSRIVSIGNRSVSRQSHIPSINARNAQTYVSNNQRYSGLQNKLDRLRLQLRKQIESIK